MKTPYQSLPDKAFWRKAVADLSMFDITDLWQPKFALGKKDKVSTYGSCFAQHIGSALRERGFHWFITEQAPNGTSDALKRRFNYEIFSARTANIYTTSLLKQWVSWASGEIPPELYWKNEAGKYIDPFRPRIEPDGFSSVGELNELRQRTIQCFKRSITHSNYFVFTLGLTESWSDRKGFEYPMCPGTVGGVYSAEDHIFENQNYNVVKRNLVDAVKQMRKLNSKLKIILTVSPVPLTATNSGEHVLVATMRSKSILRAVAAELAENMSFVDYFPSYEIINGTPFRSAFFEPNMRSVNPAGVKFVMDNFFQAINNKRSHKTVDTDKTQEKALMSPTKSPEASQQDEFCEEALLDAFASKST